MDPTFPFEVIRPWGSFRQYSKDTPLTVKIITVLPHEALSLQSHAKRAEFQRVLSGSGELHIEGKVYELKPGDEHEIPKGAKHRVEASEEGLSFLELSVGEFDEDDIIRYEDKYGRVNK